MSEQGTCTVCGRAFTLTKRGLLRRHGLKQPGVWPPRNCPGSVQPPSTGEEAPRLPDILATLPDAPRTFVLMRLDDATGVSGTGIVAEGIEFTDGTAALRWRTATSSTAVYGSMRDLEAIHGHQGATKVVYHQ